MKLYFISIKSHCIHSLKSSAKYDQMLTNDVYMYLRSIIIYAMDQYILYVVGSDSVCMLNTGTCTLGIILKQGSISVLHTNSQ